MRGGGRGPLRSGTRDGHLGSQEPRQLVDVEQKQTVGPPPGLVLHNCTTGCRPRKMEPQARTRKRPKAKKKGKQELAHLGPRPDMPSRTAVETRTEPRHVLGDPTCLRDTR